MSANRSSAVIQQRSEPHDSLDDFPTPPWATRALCEWLLARSLIMPDFVCREPAANRGHMVRPLDEYFTAVIGSDVHDYGAASQLKIICSGLNRLMSTGRSPTLLFVWRNSSFNGPSAPALLV